MGGGRTSVGMLLRFLSRESRWSADLRLKIDTIIMDSPTPTPCKVALNLPWVALFMLVYPEIALRKGFPYGSPTISPYTNPSPPQVQGTPTKAIPLAATRKALNI